jgi:hypothetical protein
VHSWSLAQCSLLELVDYCTQYWHTCWGYLRVSAPTLLTVPHVSLITGKSANFDVEKSMLSKLKMVLRMLLLCAVLCCHAAHRRDGPYMRSAGTLFCAARRCDSLRAASTSGIARRGVP